MTYAEAAWIDSEDERLPEEGTRCEGPGCEAIVGLWDHDVDGEYGPRAVMEIRPFVAVKMSDDTEWVRFCEDCASWVAQVAPAIERALSPLYYPYRP